MESFTTSYRDFIIAIEDGTSSILAVIVSASTEARFLVSGPTVFATAEKAFDLIDRLMSGAAANDSFSTA